MWRCVALYGMYPIFLNLLYFYELCFVQWLKRVAAYSPPCRARPRQDSPPPSHNTHMMPLSKSMTIGRLFHKYQCFLVCADVDGSACIVIRVADPHPDPSCPDQDLTFRFDAEPDPDPSFQIKAQDLKKKLK